MKSALSSAVLSLFAISTSFAVSAVASPILGNYPNTSLPLSTDTTVTPDATPANTVSMTVSTATDFKGTLAAERGTGVVRVTNAHPAGIYTGTVTAFDSDGATATKTFTLTVTTPVTCLPVTFAKAVNYTTGSVPQSIAVGDFNGDGKQDLAVADGGSDVIALLFGDGAGKFNRYPRLFLAGEHASSVAAGDFNGDGRQDLAVANGNSSSNTVSILLGNGRGTFKLPTSYATFISPNWVAVSDFNGDGKQDLAVVSNSSPSSVSILLGDGTGKFGHFTSFSAGNNADTVAVGDFNRDGHEDLAIDSRFPNGVSILLGDGTGRFGPPTTYAAADPISVAVGDFNGDGKQDLVTSNLGPGTVSVLLGTGSGGFSPATDFAVGVQPFSVALGDFNGDGKQDLAVANSAKNVSLLLGDGTGNFSAPVTFTVGLSPRFVAVGDFNGDGQQDLAIANGASGNLSILLRICP